MGPLRPEQPQDMHLLLAIATFVGAATAMPMVYYPAQYIPADEVLVRMPRQLPRGLRGHCIWRCTGGPCQDPDLPWSFQGRLRLCALGLLQHPACRPPDSPLESAPPNPIKLTIIHPFFNC